MLGVYCHRVHEKAISRPPLPFLCQVESCHKYRHLSSRISIYPGSPHFLSQAICFCYLCQENGVYTTAVVVDRSVAALIELGVRPGLGSRIVCELVHFKMCFHTPDRVDAVRLTAPSAQPAEELQRHGPLPPGGQCILQR